MNGKESEEKPPKPHFCPLSGATSDGRGGVCQHHACQWYVVAGFDKEHKVIHRCAVWVIAVYLSCDIRKDLKGIREALEKANENQMKSEELASGMLGGTVEILKNIALEARGKKLVELVDEEEKAADEKSVNAIFSELVKKGGILEVGHCKDCCSKYDACKKCDPNNPMIKHLEKKDCPFCCGSCARCPDYAVSEKGEKHMCMRSEPKGRYIPGSFIVEGTIPDWCPLTSDNAFSGT